MYTCTICALLCIDYSANKQTKGRNKREVRVEDDSFVKIYAAVIHVVFLHKAESRSHAISMFSLSIHVALGSKPFSIASSSKKFPLGEGGMDVPLRA